MSFLKNRIHVWHNCFKYSYFQPKHHTSKSFSVTSYAPLVHQKISIGQIIPLCSASSQTCFKLQFKMQVKCLPSVLSRPISLSSQYAVPSSSAIKGTDDQEQNKLLSSMNIRLVNENNFLSWCRNAYLSSVVGVAMITEGTTVLAQSAGVGALCVGTMNLFWGTGCHIMNLIRLRHISGMSGLNLTLNVLGSSLHCLLWIFVLVCYIGFLDETNAFEQHRKADSSLILPNMEFQNVDTGMKRKDNEV